MVFLSVKIYINLTKMVFHAIVTTIDSVGMPHGIGKVDLGQSKPSLMQTRLLARGILGGFHHLAC